MLSQAEFRVHPIISTIVAPIRKANDTHARATSWPSPSSIHWQRIFSPPSKNQQSPNISLWEIDRRHRTKRSASRSSEPLEHRPWKFSGVFEHKSIFFTVHHPLGRAPSWELSHYHVWRILAVLVRSYPALWGQCPRSPSFLLQHAQSPAGRWYSKQNAFWCSLFCFTLFYNETNKNPFPRQ